MDNFSGHDLSITDPFWQVKVQCRCEFIEHGLSSPWECVNGFSVLKTRGDRRMTNEEVQRSARKKMAADTVVMIGIWFCQPCTGRFYCKCIVDYLCDASLFGKSFVKDR